MSVRTYKLYAVITATGNALAQLDIKRPGKICGISWAAINTLTPGSNDYLQAEVSLYPGSQTNTNDPMGSLDMLCTGVQQATAVGSIQVGVNRTTVIPFGVDVKVGDRLYLHAAELGGGSWNTNAYIYVAE